MSTTTELAKRKWCPMARSFYTTGETDVTVNRSPNSGAADADCMCLADDCGVWVTDDTEQDGERFVEVGHCGLVNR